MAAQDSNFVMMHSRFAEVRKFYKGKHDMGTQAIPNDHAHPCVDSKGRISLCHCGSIANFPELLKEAQELKITLDKQITDS